LIEWWNWKKKHFNKSAKDKIKNFKNKDQNEKSSIWENCNWMTKLKKIKISINEKERKKKLIEWRLNLKSKKQRGQWYTLSV